jgi:hypothetical protein
VSLTAVADNFQLYTLIADAMAGVYPELTPDPAWVEAATTGDPDAVDRIEARFQLSNVDGTPVYLEGSPIQILLRGHRTLVIDEAPYLRTWNRGRSIRGLVPSVHIVEEIDPEIAARHIAAISPQEPPPKPRPAVVHFEQRGGASR